MKVFYRKIILLFLLQIAKKSEKDKVLLIGAGVTLHESIKASEELADQKINVRVLDPFTIKPIDRDSILKNARECGGRIITVEDHYPEGMPSICSTKI